MKLKHVETLNVYYKRDLHWRNDTNTKIFNEQNIMELAHSAYEHCQANFPIIKDQCALLVIDMQAEHTCPTAFLIWTLMMPGLFVEGKIYHV